MYTDCQCKVFCYTAGEFLREIKHTSGPQAV